VAVVFGGPAANMSRHLRRPEFRNISGIRRRARWRAIDSLGEIDFDRSFKIHWDSIEGFQLEESDDWRQSMDDMRDALVEHIVLDPSALRSLLQRVAVIGPDELSASARKELIQIIGRALVDVSEEHSSSSGERTGMEKV
jgi:hypothetical protein